MTDVRIESSWKEALREEFIQEYFRDLSSFVREEYLSTNVYPHPKNVFRAFDLCPFDKVKVVIVGQDPYHGKGQANGLSFAVDTSVPIPPSLKNIFKEIRSDLGITPKNSGDLSRWAKQGVLMLNAVLTVRAGSPASHKGHGWEEFTDAVIAKLNDEKENIVYMLWGKYAQEKGASIDRDRNLVLSSGHPSPYSAQLFHGNHHFSRCNTYLAEHGKEPIDWI
ncbi:uracil-DNA glycosylase [Candidatus Roizmanbacteria bacterium]|nr:MAG: uracil-DNA glycosylase [Candidatus Roizmanbacteria bacterium]